MPCLRKIHQDSWIIYSFGQIWIYFSILNQNLSAFNHSMAASSRWTGLGMSIILKVLIWDFCPQQSLELTQNSVKKKKKFSECQLCRWKCLVVKRGQRNLARCIWTFLQPSWAEKHDIVHSTSTFDMDELQQQKTTSSSTHVSQ